MTNATAQKTTATTLILLAVAMSVPAQPPQQPQVPLPPNRQPLIQAPLARDLRGSRLVMNYENIDIKVLARILAELTGRNVLVDDAVQGRVTILSSRAVSYTHLDVYKRQIMNREKPRTVALFSLEMSRAELVQRILCSVAQVNQMDVKKGNLKEEEWIRITRLSLIHI